MAGLQVTAEAESDCFKAAIFWCCADRLPTESSPHGSATRSTDKPARDPDVIGVPPFPYEVVELKTRQMATAMPKRRDLCVPQVVRDELLKCHP